uniref:Uncharacterized protein n=1 Tax=Chromera velia CCMP2878 TaxID=1169474 RepID=A0A0G4H563_9ALVE|eukprot:Cvel_24724.t1-p1 / transcript=Cvel_24724.t1 / gene=Cvel_24724 / organism=Chromera_velia_CCMP2878 / gene_product=hypothetical protein / transcript_product=hypothetical protein / location=Cvel_scaffold2713:12026-15596(+) / protein_length=464 / sequence_SO=supercontig / SO=protein_coding / is_pseudo=false
MRIPAVVAFALASKGLAKGAPKPPPHAIVQEDDEPSMAQRLHQILHPPSLPKPVVVEMNEGSSITCERIFDLTLVGKAGLPYSYDLDFECFWPDATIEYNMKDVESLVLKGWEEGDPEDYKMLSFDLEVKDYNFGTRTLKVGATMKIDEDASKSTAFLKMYRETIEVQWLLKLSPSQGVTQPIILKALVMADTGEMGYWENGKKILKKPVCLPTIAKAEDLTDYQKYAKDPWQRFSRTWECSNLYEWQVGKAVYKDRNRREHSRVDVAECLKNMDVEVVFDWTSGGLAEKEEKQMTGGEDAAGERPTDDSAQPAADAGGDDQGTKTKVTTYTISGWARENTQGGGFKHSAACNIYHTWEFPQVNQGYVQPKMELIIPFSLPGIPFHLRTEASDGEEDTGGTGGNPDDPSAGGAGTGGNSSGTPSSGPKKSRGRGPMFWILLILIIGGAVGTGGVLLHRFVLRRR